MWYFCRFLWVLFLLWEPWICVRSWCLNLLVLSCLYFSHMHKKHNKNYVCILWSDMAEWKFSLMLHHAWCLHIFSSMSPFVFNLFMNAGYFSRTSIYKYFYFCLLMLLCDQSSRVMLLLSGFRNLSFNYSAESNRNCVWLKLSSYEENCWTLLFMVTLYGWRFE
jgi:hypothetical protein